MAALTRRGMQFLQAKREADFAKILQCENATATMKLSKILSMKCLMAILLLWPQEFIMGLRNKPETRHMNIMTTNNDFETEASEGDLHFLPKGRIMGSLTYGHIVLRFNLQNVT